MKTSLLTDAVGRMLEASGASGNRSRAAASVRLFKSSISKAADGAQMQDGLSSEPL